MAGINAASIRRAPDRGGRLRARTRHWYQLGSVGFDLPALGTGCGLGDEDANLDPRPGGIGGERGPGISGGVLHSLGHAATFQGCGDQRRTAVFEGTTRVQKLALEGDLPLDDLRPDQRRIPLTKRDRLDFRVEAEGMTVAPDARLGRIHLRRVEWRQAAVIKKAAALRAAVRDASRRVRSSAANAMDRNFEHHVPDPG